MADQDTKSDGRVEENTQESQQNGNNAEKSLEGFITEQYRLQRENGDLDATEEIDDERRANFFARALKESQRMSRETDKSRVKMDQLHQELGAERFAAWQHEHATEVLTPEQVAAVTRASQGNF